MSHRLIAIAALVLMLCQQVGLVTAAVPVLPGQMLPDAATEANNGQASHEGCHAGDAMSPEVTEQHLHAGGDCCEQQCNCSLSGQSVSTTLTNFFAASLESASLPIYLAQAPSAPYQRLLRPPISA